LKKTLVKFLFPLLLLNNAYAATYYISPAGNDISGNGSINNPWKSLYQATSAVKTLGDIIHVSAGTYTETQQCVLAVGVSIEGEGITSVIKSSLTSDWTALLIANSDSEGTDGNQHICNLKFDGQNLSTFWAITIIGRSNFSINNCTIVDFKDRGVIFGGRVDNTNAAPAKYASGNNFHDNIMINCARYLPNQYGSGALNIGGQEGMLIYNNTITQNSRALGYNGWPIKYWNDGYLNCCKIYNNVLTKIPMDNHLGFNGWDFAIELFNESGLEIRGNTIQGAIDLNFQTKGIYDYSVWIHDNTISQPKLNSFIETGITLEFGTEDAVIENNRMMNLGIPVFFAPREGNIISNVIIKNNICENIGVADGSHQGFAVRLGSDGNNIYSLVNFFIHDNKFLANPAEKPYWGIAILGALYANNIQIRNNSIKNFSAGSITANPASVIDTMFIENNILTGNGYANRPAFAIGEPLHYVNKNNALSNPSVFSFINFKMNIVRPLYYGLKNSTILELIAFFAFIISLWLSIKENIYFYPLLLVCAVIYILLRLENDLIAEACIFLYFALMSIYGWVMWSKRDKRQHRIFRISASTKKELPVHFGIFVFFFIANFAALTFLIKDFTPGSIPWADAFVYASAFTGMWLMTKKKIESWYWLITSAILLIPLLFIKHYVVNSVYFIFLLALAFIGLIKWKRIIKNKSRTEKKTHTL
jgi:nicotinamide mononucleotide transporter